MELTEFIKELETNEKASLGQLVGPEIRFYEGIGIFLSEPTILDGFKELQNRKCSDFAIGYLYAISTYVAAPLYVKAGLMSLAELKGGAENDGKK